MKKGRVKPLMRHQCDIKATSKRVASQAVATPKPLSCDLQATFMRPSSHLHATSKPPSCDLKATLMRPQSHPHATSKPHCFQAPGSGHLSCLASVCSSA